MTAYAVRDGAVRDAIQSRASLTSGVSSRCSTARRASSAARTGDNAEGAASNASMDVDTDTSSDTAGAKGLALAVTAAMVGPVLPMAIRSTGDDVPNEVAVDGQVLRARHILVATGGRPVVPDIPGQHLVISSDQIFDLEPFPKRLLVVGGGYIACEFASIFKGLGARVTQLYRGAQVLRGFDEEIRGFIAAEMVKAGVDLRLNADVAAIVKTANGLQVTLQDGSAVETDAVLYATGRVPLAEGLGLQALGIAAAAVQHALQAFLAACSGPLATTPLHVLGQPFEQLGPGRTGIERVGGVVLRAGHDLLAGDCDGLRRVRLSSVVRAWTGNQRGFGLGTRDQIVGDVAVIGGDDDQQFHRLVKLGGRQGVMGFAGGHDLVLNAAGAGDG